MSAKKMTQKSDQSVAPDEAPIELLILMSGRVTRLAENKTDEEGAKFYRGQIQKLNLDGEGIIGASCTFIVGLRKGDENIQEIRATYLLVMNKKNSSRAVDDLLISGARVAAWQSFRDYFALIRSQAGFDFADLPYAPDYITFDDRVAPVSPEADGP